VVQVASLENQVKTLQDRVILLENELEAARHAAIKAEAVVGQLKQRATPPIGMAAAERVSIQPAYPCAPPMGGHHKCGCNNPTDSSVVSRGPEEVMAPVDHHHSMAFKPPSWRFFFVAMFLASAICTMIGHSLGGNTFGGNESPHEVRLHAFV